jgi:ABC-2 type transport system ATP-binding protein
VNAAIRTEALRKVYTIPASGPPRDWMNGPARATGWRRPPGKRDSAGPRDVVALVGLDLEVPAGEFFGLLGPNGAGKTTTIGILTTRVLPTSGRALVAGADVLSAPVTVRQRIGVVPQRPNPDRSLSVLENLVFHAAYFGVRDAAATRRARMLLDEFSIGEKANAKVDELSGGQQQRLMIARALIHEPSVLFLDEPTVGLDPQARHALWEILRQLHAQQRTIVMTTHYMDEADQLCDRIAIVDGGRLLAIDTPETLKARAPGGTLIELTLDGEAADAVARARILAGVLSAEAHGDLLRVYSGRGGQIIPPIIEAAQAAGRTVTNIHLATPSLETLFISLTGHGLAPDDTPGPIA